MHESKRQRFGQALCPEAGEGGVWRRRSSAAPAVTLESKLLALRASPSKEAEAAFIVEARPFCGRCAGGIGAGPRRRGFGSGGGAGPRRGDARVEAWWASV